MISPVLPVYQRTDFAIERGEGAYVWTSDGRKLLDFVAGIAVNTLGHCHPKLVKALEDQAHKVWHVSNFYRIELQEKLADRLCNACFADSVFFGNSGAEAGELAVKMARKYFHNKGQPERHRIITVEGCFHGRTMAMISASGAKKLVDGFAPLVEGFDIVPFGDHDALKAAIGPETAAIMVEPVMGEGGIKPLPLECLNGLRSLCDEHGILLIFDEVQCGVGRTGALYAHQRANAAAPDIMMTAKGIGGGFPLGGCLATEAVASAMNPGSHGTTYGGNPLAMAVGYAVLDEVLSDGFLDNVKARGEQLQQGLQALASQFPNLVEDARGIGLMQGIKLRGDQPAFINQLQQEGMLAVTAGDNVVRFVPPLNIEAAHVDEAIDKLHSCCQALSR